MTDKTDRELLTLAAKAAGIQGHFENSGEDAGLFCYNLKNPSMWLRWNPLTDDGDRYRLAQKLGISIDYEDCCAWTRKHGTLIQEFWGGDCPDEAHVIVGVAAEIGKTMPS